MKIEVRIQDHTLNVVGAIGSQLTSGIRSATKEAAASYKRKVSRPYPPSSARGEYPRLRTGTGRSAVVWRMDDAEGVVEIQPHGRHLQTLTEARWSRLGLADSVMEDMADGTLQEAFEKGARTKKSGLLGAIRGLFGL